MRLLMVLIVSGLYTAAFYMIMRRSMTKLIIGLSLLGHASNLLIFTAGGLIAARPPIIRAGGLPAEGGDGYADPLPQALILTAIVIGFGLQAFTIVLIKRVYETVGTDDLDTMSSTDQPEIAGGAAE